MSRWKRLPGNASLCLLGILVTLSPAQAQIRGDGTLNTQVNGNLTAPCTGTCIITNGTTRGGNLFHSFRQFSLPNGDFAGFVTTPAIQNVIVRVTGVGQPFVSNINGRIATTNAAVTVINPTNFFLLNPNGIVFGPNARVLVGGSFLATTADRMVFQDGAEFRTTDPAPLLTINVPIGLGFTGVPQPIKLQGVYLDTYSRFRNSSFRDFALVGGNLVLDDTQIGIRGGRIELTSIGTTGLVGLGLKDSALRLNAPDTLTRADVTLTNASILGIDKANGGDIAINARNLSLANASGISISSLGDQAGDIVLNATNTIALSQGSLIGNLDPEEAIGNGGDIRIQTGSLSVTGRSGLLTAHLGQGDSGSIIINARDTIAFDGLSSASVTNTNRREDGSRDASSRGNSGDIRVNTGSLSLTNGSNIEAINDRPGTAGNITIHARDAISLDGEAMFMDKGKVKWISSSIMSGGGFNGDGNGGNIHLTTGSLKATNGASIDASSFGQGNAGNITIDARDAVTFDGRSRSHLIGGVMGSLASGVNSDVTLVGNGNGGDIQITTNALSVSNGAGLTANTLGKGNAGNINIIARDRVTVDGVSTDGSSSSVSSAVGPRAVGNGGSIRIATNVLSITNGANLKTGTQGQGNGGKIVVNANDRTIVDGVGSNGDFSSIQSAIVANPFGDLPFTAARKGGDLAITTGALLLNGGFLSTGVESTLGEAGNINVRTSRLQLDNGATISTTAASGNGGNITLFARDLFLLRRNSVITARSGTLGTGQGNGGNILINTPFLVSAPLENSDIRATAFGGRGGSVTINATGIYWFVSRSRADLERLLGTTDPTQLDSLRLPTNDITAISQANPTLNGQVILNTPDLDPNRGLVALPTELIDPTHKIDQRCVPQGGQQTSSFTVTGRGGLASSPTEPLMQQGALMALVKLPDELEKPTGNGSRTDEADKAGSASVSSVTPSAANEIIEANGWNVDAEGNVQLVAYASTEKPSSPVLGSLTCTQR